MSSKQDRKQLSTTHSNIAIPDIPPGTPLMSMEAALARPNRRPLALAGIVENGLVRPLDPSAKLPDRACVIIVTSGE